MNRLNIKTQEKKQIVDITEKVEELIKKEEIKEGVCYLYVAHTTCCLTTADLDPGTDLDMLDAFEEMIPKLDYRHPHDPSHVSDHILSSLIGPTVAVPIENGKLILGTWQRVVLVELKGPRDRRIVATFLSESK